MIASQAERCERQFAEAIGNLFVILEPERGQVEGSGDDIAAVWRAGMPARSPDASPSHPTSL
jgi:hypothetical protein